MPNSQRESRELIFNQFNKPYCVLPIFACIIETAYKIEYILIKQTYQTYSSAQSVLQTNIIILVSFDTNTCTCNLSENVEPLEAEINLDMRPASWTHKFSVGCKIFNFVRSLGHKSIH